MRGLELLASEFIPRRVSNEAEDLFDVAPLICTNIFSTWLWGGHLARPDCASCIHNSLFDVGNDKS
ncbi:hypothetical protein GXM_00374 [Nostoc sphaeroides CCNUC1]|uniref:Uncharacterized protein n=1 Tax=Nostoc sphaeroides CCNUC1 TaxID=2653204 RepID=A0A5P8VRI4_9NOSO|nr:hypothetical protein GXM_00374 [Nostoc sphaeroides CCNUC1]